MSKIDLIFACSEFGTTDVLPSKGEFNKIVDVNEWLWEKYDDKIEGHLNENYDNLMPGRDRAPLTFTINNIKGENVVLEPTKNLVDIAEITDQVNWHPYVMGGITPVQKFSNHVSLIVGDSSFENWTEIEKGKPGKGLNAVGPGPDGVIRIWKIIPSSDYPNTPPIVFGEPAFTADPCFETGILKYVKDKNGNDVWSTLAKNYFNPLNILLHELFVKYKIGV